jgi:hypothetical protein
VLATGDGGSESAVGQQLAARLDVLLNTEAVARRCAALAQQLRAVDGIGLTCDQLESLQP